MMKAIQMSRFGGPWALERVEIALPEPRRGQVLVRVRASGVNFADTLARENRYAMTPPLPCVPGSEAAGVIEGLGKGMSGLTIGMRVAAPLFASGKLFGGYAGYLVIDADLAAPIPHALSFEQATALMVQGLTALYLTRQAPPKGKTVLVMPRLVELVRFSCNSPSARERKLTSLARVQQRSALSPSRSVPILVLITPSLAGLKHWGR
jgi:NADPH2:quinone reductase